MMDEGREFLEKEIHKLTFLMCVYCPEFSVLVIFLETTLELVLQP